MVRSMLLIRLPESDGGIFPYKSSEKGDKIGAFVTFQTKEKEQILVKVALSYIDIEGARRNLSDEMKGWNFDLVKASCRSDLEQGTFEN